MHRYIALLRAINVGGHNVKMADLRVLFEALGFSNVATFIASGNVIFDAESGTARDLETQIEQHLKGALGYEVTTFLRTPAEVAAVAAYQPFPATDLGAEGSSLYMMFLQAPLSDDSKHKLLALQTSTDAFHCRGREIYWLCRTNVSQSSLFSGPLLGKTIGVPTTMRNATTVRKLAAKYAAPA